MLLSFAPDILVKDIGPAAMQDALNGVPEVDPWLAIVGVYDGDMRGKVESHRWPITFLPGLEGPEKLLRGTSARIIEELVRSAGRPEGHVRAALGEQDGKEDHDWFEDLSRALNLPLDALMRALDAVWMEIEANRAAGEEAAREIVKTLDIARPRPLVLPASPKLA